MKKLIWTLSALSLACTMMACNDDPIRYCDSGFIEGCYGGEWLECVFENVDDKRGTVQAFVELTYKGTTYTCSQDNVLYPTTKCENSTFEGGNNTICGQNGSIYMCDDNKVIKKDSYCDGTKIHVCNEGGEVTVATNCNNEGKICEEMERNGVFAAMCFNNEEVKTGCEDGLTPYGVCNDDANTLKFCTNSDPTKGKTIELKCGDTNATCALVEESTYGYDCVYTCNDNQGKQLSDRGYCSNSTLHYCEDKDKDGTMEYHSYDCAQNEMSTSCGFVGEYFDCKQNIE